MNIKTALTRNSLHEAAFYATDHILHALQDVPDKNALGIALEILAMTEQKVRFALFEDLRCELDNSIDYSLIRVKENEE